MCILTAAGRTRSFSQYDQGLSTVVLATFRGIWQTFLQVARATSYPRSRKFGLGNMPGRYCPTDDLLAFLDSL
jgi:hypothetical protein